jgi:hypothetical protein
MHGGFLVHVAVLQVAIIGSHQHALAQIDTAHVGVDQGDIAQRGALQIGASLAPVMWAPVKSAP